MPFNFQRLSIPDVILVEPRAFEDERGFFMESYRESDFVANGIVEKFVQDNFSHSKKGVLRGLHFQRPPMAQGKLVRVIRGEILDVAVDIRKGSPTYGEWTCATLSAENRNMLYIPPEFAHGFYTVSDEADVAYKVTKEYSAEHDAGVVWNDPDIGVNWPTARPLLSPKDEGWPRLAELQSAFEYVARLS